MQCNINARGKAIRLLGGVILAAVGLVILLAGQGRTWSLIAGFSCLLGGAFMIFEGAAGWCAVRAMGFKTKV